MAVNRTRRATAARRRALRMGLVEHDLSDEQSTALAALIAYC